MKNEIIARLSRALFCLGRISVEGRKNIDNIKEVFDRLEELTALLNECEITPREQLTNTDITE